MHFIHSRARSYHLWLYDDPDTSLMDTTIKGVTKNMTFRKTINLKNKSALVRISLEKYENELKLDLKSKLLLMFHMACVMK